MSFTTMAAWDGSSSLGNCRRLSGIISSNSKGLMQLKSDIKRILTCDFQEYRVSNLRNKYKSLTGSSLPYVDFGFTSTVNLLQTFSDFELDYTRIEEDPVVRLKADKAVYKRMKLLKSSFQENEKESKRELNPNEIKKAFIPFYVQDSIRDLLEQHNGTVCKFYFYEYLLNEFPLKDFGLDIGVQELANAAPHVLSVEDDKVRSPYKIEKCGNAKQTVDEAQWTIPCVRNSYLEMKLGRDIEKLLDEHPSGVDVNELPHKYFYAFDSKLDIAEFGFVSLSAFVMLLPGDFKMVRSDDKYVLISKTSKSYGEKYNYRERLEQMLMGVSGLHEIKVKLQNLAFQYSYGVELHHFFNFSVAKFLFRLLLDHQKYSEEEFAQHLTAERVITLKEIYGRLFVFPNGGWLYKGIATEPFPHYPENVMKPRDVISKMPLPTKGPGTFTVFWGTVSTVNNPGDFYVRLEGTHRSRHEDHVFQAVHRSVDKFYNKNFRSYIMPLNAVKVGMICAASIQGCFRRIRILGPASNTEVFAQDIDTGRKHRVAKAYLLFLDKVHNFEMRVYPASVVDVKPLGGKWTIDSTMYFADHLLKKKMYIYVFSANGKGVLNVNLRTEGNDLITILLVDAGHARRKLSFAKDDSEEESPPQSGDDLVFRLISSYK